MTKGRYCGMCDKWFARLKTIWCPRCGDKTDPMEKDPNHEHPAAD